MKGERIMKKWLIAGRICLIVLGVLLFLFIIGFGRNFIEVWQVDKITLEACNGIVELTDAEVFGMSAIYALSREAGRVTAEGCSHKFEVKIYMKDGGYITIEDDQTRGHLGDRMKVSGSGMESVWLDNALLVGYIRMLVNNHGLTWDTFSCQ